MTQKDKDLIMLITQSVKDMFNQEGEIPMMLCYCSKVEHMKKISGSKLRFDDIMKEIGIEVDFYIEPKEEDGITGETIHTVHSEDALSCINLNGIMENIENSYADVHKVKMSTELAKKTVCAIILKIIHFFQPEIICHISEAYMVSSLSNSEDIMDEIKKSGGVKNVRNSKEIVSLLFEKEGFHLPQIFEIKRDVGVKPVLLPMNIDKLEEGFKPIESNESLFNDMIKKSKKMFGNYSVRNEKEDESGFKAILNILNEKK